MFPTKMIIDWDLIIFRCTKTSYFSLGTCEFALKSAAEIAVVRCGAYGASDDAKLLCGMSGGGGYYVMYIYKYTYTYYVYDFAMQKL